MSLPLNENADVRAVTLSPLILVNALMISSASPSLKYSCSLLPLMLTKGRTAIDGGQTLAGLVVSCSKAASRSRAFWKRCEGCFDKQRFTISDIGDARGVGSS